MERPQKESDINSPQQPHSVSNQPAHENPKKHEINQNGAYLESVEDLEN
jgi:hypothetical protein